MKCPKCTSKNLEPDPKGLGQRICFECGTLLTQQAKPHWKLLHILLPILFVLLFALSLVVAPKFKTEVAFVSIVSVLVALIAERLSVEYIEKPLQNDETHEKLRNDRISYNVKLLRTFSWIFGTFDILFIGAIAIGAYYEPVPQQLFWKLVGLAILIAVAVLFFKSQAKRYEKMGDPNK